MNTGRQQFRRCSRPADRTGLAFAVALACLSGSVWAQGDRDAGAAERRFLWNQGCSRLAAAATPSDFHEAAAVYHQLVMAGARSGPLFYNYGSALLEAGEPELALAVLERAERYAGYREDIRRNMVAATEADSGPSLPWFRNLLFWHFRLDLRSRTTAALVGVVLLWLALTMRLLNRRASARTLFTGGIVAVALFGSSVAASLHAEQRDALRERTLLAAYFEAQAPGEARDEN
jgi:hypothetical protein